ncbi:glycosyltransferase family 4 protein [Spirosoma gilvum]
MLDSNVYVNARFLTQKVTGVQRFAIELSLKIKKIFPTIRFVSPKNIVDSSLASELDVECWGNITNGQMWEQLELPFFLRNKKNPILINLGNSAPIYYNKNIVCVHDIAFYHHPEWYSKQFAFIYKLMIPRVAKNARHLLTVSNYSQDDICRTLHIPKERIDIIYSSVSELFQAPPSNLLPNRYGRYILGVSSIDPRKNFLGLIKAFKAARLTDTRLVIVGQQHKVFADNTLRSLIEGDEAVTFTGYVNDNELISLYHHAALFAYPSFFEGFGLPPLEAMACGCPTLVSNTTSLPEVCADASLYVDPYDISSIQAGLERIMTDEALRGELVRLGYERVRYFSEQNSAQKFANIIKRSIDCLR